MKQAWCVQAHSNGSSRAKRRLGSIDDRYNPSLSASHRRQSAQKGALPRDIGRSQGGLTTKLHVVCDGKGRPVLLRLTQGQASDHPAALAMLQDLPPARHLLADRAYSSIAFRNALAQRGIKIGRAHV